jgi:hypothetical protein
MCALAIVSSLYEQTGQSSKKGKVIDCSMVEGKIKFKSYDKIQFKNKNFK